MDSKWIGFSKTFIGLVIVLLGVLLSKYGFVFDADTQKDTATTLSVIAEAVGSLVVIWGRVAATKDVHLLPKIGSQDAAKLLLLCFLALGLTGCVGAQYEVPKIRDGMDAAIRPVLSEYSTQIDAAQKRGELTADDVRIRQNTLNRYQQLLDESRKQYPRITFQ